MNLAIFDLHCDTAYALLNNGCEQQLSLRENSLHIDLAKSTSFSDYVQCFACFTSHADPLCRALSPEKVFQLEYDTIMRQLQNNQDMVRLACSSEEIDRNREKHLISAIMTIEGAAGFGYDPGRLDELYQKGFRISTLGWNDDNPLTGSHASGGGLSERGREYVRNAQRLGILIDVSHISDHGFWDVMDITESCIIASHSNSRALHSVSRNLTDEMFRAICLTGGIAGINLYTGFLGSQPTLDTVCDHILHFLEMDPTGKHIALGGDLDGCESLPSGFCDLSSYMALAERMLARGISQEILSNICWNNAKGVFDKCCT